ncbi:carbon-nitrogen hydrolase [Xylaria sp. FL0043]|nr:carbon-nitrogen hydrolase [Xylaria sp. FL0043]
MAKAAVGQICSSNSMTSNLAQCVKLVGRAASAGAKILFLPEASDYIGTSPQESLSLARPVASSPFVTGLQAAAAQHSIAVHVGIHVPVTVKPSTSTSPSTSSNPFNTTPIPQFEKEHNTSSSSPTPDAAATAKLYNRTIYINPNGSLHPSGSYDKLHLFDYATLRESASTQAGASLIAPIPSPVGRLGSLICFDLRFPEPALRLAHWHTTTNSKKSETKDKDKDKGNDNSNSNSDGSDSDGPAQILLYPSAFTVPTGRAHWEVLLRARAIETQSYVIAAAQVGAHNVDTTSSTSSSTSTSSATTTVSEGGGGSSGKDNKKKKPRVSYGHSMVVDPWGRVILEMKGVRPDWDGEDSADAVEDSAVGELGIVDIDLEEWKRVRERMPLIRRTDVYPEI